MAAPLSQHRYTPEEYLAYERGVEERNEYIAGQIVAMSGAGHAHSLIKGNLLALLHYQLRDSPCEIYASMMRVKIPACAVYTYPDLTAVCDEPQLEDSYEDSLLNPTLIIEVLSPATELYDRKAKFGYYRQLPSLQEYLLVAQDQRRIEHFVRAEGGWLLTEPEDPAVLHLPSIGCTVPVAEVYRKVRLPLNPTPAEPPPDALGGPIPSG